VLVLSISDPPQGFTAVVRDLTTHQTGFMTASAANGFMNTNIADCSGTPFTFHAEYNTAKQPNQVPWAALEGGVLMQQEIGHGEVCNSVTNNLPAVNASGATGYTDPDAFQTCVGGSEGPQAVGEGPCSPTTGLCQNATTQGPNGPVACPTNNPASGALCEFSDGYCFPKGARTAFIDGKPVTEASRAAECNQERTQNGDLDYDGQSYLADWPIGAKFYPFWSLSRYSAGWEATRPYACRTSATTSPTPCGTSAGTLSTARLTWPATAARSPAPSSPIRSSAAAAKARR
jgi:hypothetical protein